VNTGELEFLGLYSAELRVLEIQAKLHRWARDDPHRRFSDLFNLVADPAFLLVAWDRVRGNKGARTPGVDGATASSIEYGRGAGYFLSELRSALTGRSFRPLPVRERLIPKANGTLRRLGIATIRDRVVQASLKLVLEPIFEADFHPCSYGFRPGRRAHDAIAETVMFVNNKYEWVVEGDITACFDEISHPALMGRVRARIGDKRILELVKAFLKAGILSEDGTLRDSHTGAPQGGILSPLLSNVALSVLDEYIVQIPGGAIIQYGRAGQTQTPRAGQLSSDQVRGRLAAAGGRHSRACPEHARPGSSGTRPDGLAPVGREDKAHPYRRRHRLLGMAHPAAS
jgi:RNA-directed DNA polymerase